MKERIKQLRTEVQTLTNQGKALYAELEEKFTSKGQEVPQEESNKLNTLIDDGFKKREELERLEKLADNDEYVNKPAGERQAKEGQDPRRSRKTRGQLVIESAQFKSGRESKKGVMEPVQVKAIYGSEAGQGGVFVRADRQDEIITLPRRPLMVQDLVNRAETESNAVEYLEMTVRTNNATPTPERNSTNTGFAQKPESDLSFELKSALVRTIPTWIAASKTILDDAPRLRDMIDNELEYMVLEDLEREILIGDGTGYHFLGMLNWPGIQQREMHGSAPVGRGQKTTDTRLDTLRRAITDITLAFYRADATVLNPVDAEALELAKDDEGRYMQIYDPVQQRVWRINVVEAPVMPVATGLVGNMRLAATLWDRMETQISVGYPYGFFVQNAVAILAELRAAFAVTRPQALEEVKFI